MAIIDVRCTVCNHRAEVSRPAAEWPATPPCETCQGATEQIHLPHGFSSAAPVVVFQAPDGSFRFPGTPDGLYARKCEREGMTRVELRGFADVRRFESQANKHEFSKIQRRVERQQAAQEAGERIRRSDFHHGLHAGFQMPEREENAKGEIVDTGRMKHVQIGPRAREIARILMDRNNGKRVQSYDPGFHLEAYSNDRSNREASRDEHGRKRRD